MESKELGKQLETKVAIGDDKVLIDDELIEYENITNYIKEYITKLGGFEKFAEWGIQY